MIHEEEERGNPKKEMVNKQAWTEETVLFDSPAAKFTERHGVGEARARRGVCALNASRV